jgi:hypothetical protein
VEGGGDAAAGDGVVDERLVERLLHEREGGDAGELDAGRGEEEVLLVGRASEEGHTADVAIDLAPVVEHGVCVGDDGGEDELAGDGEEGSRERARDGDWIGAWWLGVDVDVEKPGKDEVGPTQEAFGGNKSSQGKKRQLWKINIDRLNVIREWKHSLGVERRATALRFQGRTRRVDRVNRRHVGEMRSRDRARPPKEPSRQGDELREGLGA